MPKKVTSTLLATVISLLAVASIFPMVAGAQSNTMGPTPTTVVYQSGIKTVPIKSLSFSTTSTNINNTPAQVYYEIHVTSAPNTKGDALSLAALSIIGGGGGGGCGTQYTGIYKWWVTNGFGQELYGLQIEQQWTGDGTNICGWAPTIAATMTMCCGWQVSSINAGTPTWYNQPTEAASSGSGIWVQITCIPLVGCFESGSANYATNVFFKGNGYFGTSP